MPPAPRMIGISGRDVDVLEAGLDDEVDVARGEQAIAVAVEAIADGQRRFADSPPLGPEVAAVAHEEVGRGGGQPGLAELGDGAGLERQRLVAAVVARVAGNAQIDLAGEGLGHEAGDGAAIDHEADQRAPDRNAGDEGAGAVDGVDDPGEAARSPACRRAPRR